MNIDYNKQAKDFLQSIDTTLTIKRATPQKAPLWSSDGKYRVNYTCTLENKHHKYTFDFWDSIHNSEIIEAIEKYQSVYMLQSGEDYARQDLFKKEGISLSLLRDRNEKQKILEKYQPNEYDILACLSPLYENDFKDFCDTFGYDSDSITGLKTFEAVKEQDRNLRILWDRSQLEALTEIQ